MELTRVDEEYISDVPKAIEKKIRLLRQQEGGISELEAKLGVLRHEHRALKQDLEPYRANFPLNDSHTNHQSLDQIISRQRAASPIDRCPNEILYSIFEEYLDGDGRHPFIRRLLLVCRRWHNIVVNGAKLWARIDLASVWDLFSFPAQELKASYIATCMARSKGILLSVKVDMTFVDETRYIGEGLCQCALAMTNIEDHYRILRELRFLNWDFKSDRFYKELRSALDLFLGCNATHTRRWGHLDIKLPSDDELAIDIWRTLRKSCSQLTSITIENLPINEEFINEEPIEMGDLPPWNLEKLDLGAGIDSYGISAPISQLKISSETLRYLAIAISPSTLENLTELSSFKFLRTLKIKCDYPHGLLDVDLSLHLPHLDTLTLAMDYFILSKVKFTFPSLDLLVIEVGKTAGDIPVLSPRRLKVLSLGLQEFKMDVVIYEFILPSSTLRSISVERHLREDAISAVTRCKADGAAALLTQIVLEDEGSTMETIEV